VQPHHLVMPLEKKLLNELFEYASDFRDPTAPDGGISEGEFVNATHIIWPGHKNASAVSRAFAFAHKAAAAGENIASADGMTSALNFVVYANNLQALFDNVDTAGTGSLTRSEFEACAPQFEIDDSDAAFNAMIAFVNATLGMTLPADSETVPFDLFCVWLSHEKPFFDVEVEVSEVAVPQAGAGGGGAGAEGGDDDKAFTGSFEVVRTRRAWKKQAPWGDLDNLQLPSDPLLLEDLFDYLDPKDTKTITRAQFVKACCELWPGFNNAFASAAACDSVHGQDDRIPRRKFGRALQYVVYSNNLYNLFDEADEDGNKRVVRSEFLAIAAQFNFADPAAAFDAMDTKKRGFLRFEEFCEWIAAHKEHIESHDEVNIGGK
jgi:Ca2+-binding EF-hand superfamily protein